METSNQRSYEWYAARLGKFTSSEIHKLLKPKGIDGGGDTYIKEKLAEIVTGEIPQASGYAVEWGCLHEHEAVQRYEKEKGVKVEECGFFSNTDYFGGSPDGLIDGGIIEAKCPFASKNHVAHMLIETQEEFKKILPEYYAQIQGNLWITERNFCDFISYDPRMKNIPYQIKIIRIDRDEDFINLIKDRTELASNILNQYINKITQWEQ